MEAFWKITGAVLLSLVLGMTVDKQERDIGLVLSMLVCCLAGLGAVSCLEPAMDFFWELQAAVGFPAGLLTSLIKAVGIALLRRSPRPSAAMPEKRPWGKCSKCWAVRRC